LIRQGARSDAGLHGGLEQLTARSGVKGVKVAVANPLKDDVSGGHEISRVGSPRNFRVPDLLSGRRIVTRDGRGDRHARVALLLDGAQVPGGRGPRFDRVTVRLDLERLRI